MMKIYSLSPKKLLSMIVLLLLVISASSCGVYIEDEIYEEYEYLPDSHLQLSFVVSWNAQQTYYNNDLEFDLVTPNYQRVSRFNDTSRCYYDEFFTGFMFDENSMVIQCEPALLGDYDLEIRSNIGNAIHVNVQIDQSWDYDLPYPLEYANFDVLAYETLVYPVYIY
ncbi:hypothetical protein MRY82_09835 [bacterium]|nr:hypothetical protein [bacterium]